MSTGWRESRRAFGDAARWFVAVTARVEGRWERPGLGEWDVRALVGHTSRALLTVESYLHRPAESVQIRSAAEYYRATRSIATGPDVAERGREAGAALGADAVAAVAAIAARVAPLLDEQDGTALVTTVAGGMRLADYLPTRTFELAVHTADLAAALGEPIEVPEAAAEQALALVTDLAITDGRAGELLLAATGRRHTEGFTVL
ncbi:maleylpyruvate isomerase N-terminal domain-containing protein [Ruania albidiflava]|uniref:maleylpyruvate isomerase N-terminal domain-containing protein n=1 Tax=Ruania albidiflava TaxID=366586 RepID=UPI0003B6987D|nr:maleylpyruvate isomerase N-terminal domain-containing protein [Ruania albidiflava]